MVGETWDVTRHVTGTARTDCPRNGQGWLTGGSGCFSAGPKRVVSGVLRGQGGRKRDRDHRTSEQLQ